VPDYSFLAKTNVPDSVGTLGGIMGIASGAKDLQLKQQALQSGALDIAKKQGTLQPGIEQARAEAQRAQTEALKAQLGYTSEKVGKAHEMLGGALLDDRINSPDVNKRIELLNEVKDRARTKLDLTPAETEAYFQPFATAAIHAPQNLGPMIKSSIVGNIAASGQPGVLTPSGPAVSNNQQSAVINTAPFAAGTGVGQPIAGTQQQQQLPPTTPVFNAGTNTPGYLGPQPPQGKITGNAPDEATALRIVQEASKRGQGATIQSGPALGVPESVAGTAASVNKDWDAATESAKTASTDIANLENIKRFAKGAMTGVEADRRSYLSGLAGLLGMKEGELAKTNTDLLAKNANMLALAGGDTNLAKTMAESANPNTHMTKEAISEAANQIIAQRRLALAKQEFMRPYKALNDPDVYNKALIEFNKNADPRALQWLHMSLEEKKSLKASLSPQEHDALRTKIQRLSELGILK
jgi:hypothetical protein